MKIRLLAGAACAALLALPTPAVSATSPELPTAVSDNLAANQAVNVFYASRNGVPLWLKADGGTAARDLIGILQRAPLDGMSNGPAFAAQAAALLGLAQSGDVAARDDAERLLSSAWIQYVEALQTPPVGMTYADKWVMPRRDSAATILARAANAPSLAGHVRNVSNVNPLYTQLREAAWSSEQENGGQLDPRILASLDRARDVPPQGRYVMIDTAGARLYMIDDGNVVDSMKVIVGKSDASTQTPMIASTIYYATLKPYWHVSEEILRSTIAPNVLNMGLGYIKSRGYQVMSADGEMLDPAKVNPNGGAVALGHPIGATGSVLTVKALAELERTQKRYALVTMCIGGGQGIAAIFERI